MRQLLEELLSEVRRVNPAAASTLRPGLAEEFVRGKMSALPFSISEDAVALYTWADGSDQGFEMLPGDYFYPLEESLVNFGIYYGMKDQLQKTFPEPYFDSYRFLGDLSDGGYAFGSVNSASRGCIVRLVIHDSWKVAFQDLRALVRTAIECYRQGVFSPDSNEVDFKAYYEMATLLNPGMEYWRAPGG